MVGINEYFTRNAGRFFTYKDKTLRQCLQGKLRTIALFFSVSRHFHTAGYNLEYRLDGKIEMAAN